MVTKKFLIFSGLILSTLNACSLITTEKDAFPVISPTNASDITDIEGLEISTGEMIWTADGSRILVFTGSKIISINPDTLEQKIIQQFPIKFLRKRAISPDGQKIAIVVDGFTDAEIWRINPQEHLMSLNEADGYSESMAIDFLLFSPNGQHLATAGWNEKHPSVYLWDLDSKKLSDSEVLVDIGPAYDRPFHNLSFSPDGQLLALLGWEGSIYVWDIQKDLLTTVRTGAQADDLGYTSALGFSPDSKFLAYGEGIWSKTIRIFDVHASQSIREIKGYMGNLSIFFSPDGNLLAICGSDTVRLWDFKTGRHLITLTIPGAWNAAFSPDGTRLATYGVQDGLRLWGVTEP